MPHLIDRETTWVTVIRLDRDFSSRDQRTLLGPTLEKFESNLDPPQDSLAVVLLILQHMLPEAVLIGQLLHESK